MNFRQRFKMILAKTVTQREVAELLWDLFPEGKVYIDPRHIDKSFGEIKLILPLSDYASYYNFENIINKRINKIDCSIVNSFCSLSSKVAIIEGCHGGKFVIECLQENTIKTKKIREIYRIFR